MVYDCAQDIAIENAFQGVYACVVLHISVCMYVCENIKKIYVYARDTTCLPGCEWRIFMTITQKHGGARGVMVIVVGNGHGDTS